MEEELMPELSGLETTQTNLNETDNSDVPGIGGGSVEVTFNDNMNSWVLGTDGMIQDFEEVPSTTNVTVEHNPFLDNQEANSGITPRSLSSFDDEAYQEIMEATYERLRQTAMERVGLRTERLREEQNQEMSRASRPLEPSDVYGSVNIRPRTITANIDRGGRVTRADRPEPITTWHNANARSYSRNTSGLKRYMTDFLDEMRNENDINREIYDKIVNKLMNF